MARSAESALAAAIASLPLRYKGPGGAVAVVQDGLAIVRHCWGFANLASREVMTPSTLMPICSITKQFTCQVLLDTIPGLADLDDALARYLPLLEGPRPSIAHLCHNQSGLRDYPPLTILCGADAEADFRPEDARRILSGMRSTHFQPGTQYSYANSNFHILSDLLEERLNRPLGDLIAERIFKPAGMTTARYVPESGAYAKDCTGYEGNVATGFMPAIHRSHWTGDAGISASLNDMIAYETFIDATRLNPNGLYRRISEPQTYSDGKPAFYGFGLAHRQVAGTAITGHAGGIRGWRMYRLYAPDERMSVVIMFNHEGDAQGAADFILASALGPDELIPPSHSARAVWSGDYVNDDSGLSISLTSTKEGYEARFLDMPELFEVGHDGIGRSPAMVLAPQADGLRYQRPADNLDLTMRVLAGEAAVDVEGRFHCREIDAEMILSVAGGALFAAFEGFLGQSVLHLLYPIGPDVWLLPTQRGIDVAPGSWTLVFERAQSGAITGFTIGCWLARNLQYRRT